MLCPNCGAEVIIRGTQWECGYCGDCGRLIVQPQEEAPETIPLILTILPPNDDTKNQN